jgi:hypothetical protein
MCYVYETFWPNWILSPGKELAEIYANAVSHYIDNAFNAAKLVNTITIANMEAFGISVQKANEIAKELSRIGTNNAELFQMAREVFVKPLNWPLDQSFGIRAEELSFLLLVFVSFLFFIQCFNSYCVP